MTHSIAQGEGGEQGDPLMPLLFALRAAPSSGGHQNRLDPSEKVFACLDDIYIKSEASRVGVGCKTVQRELFNHCHIRVHTGDLVGKISEQSDPRCFRLEKGWFARSGPRVARSWDTSWPPSPRGGSVADSGDRTPEVPLFPRLQCALSLLLHCAKNKATHFVMAVRPGCSFSFAVA